MECVDEAVLTVCAPSAPSRNCNSGTCYLTLPCNSKPFVPAPWWNGSCDDAVKDRRRTIIEFRKHSDYKNYIAYKKTAAKAKRILNKARRTSFQSFCDLAEQMCRSCADNLAVLSTEVWTGFASREVTAGLCLDFKGAFPSVTPQLLMEESDGRSKKLRCFQINN